MNGKMRALAEGDIRPNEDIAQRWCEVMNAHLIRWGNTEDQLFDADKIELLKRVDKYQIEQFAYFLQRMKSVQEGDATPPRPCTPKL